MKTKSKLNVKGLKLFIGSELALNKNTFNGKNQLNITIIWTRFRIGCIK